MRSRFFNPAPADEGATVDETQVYRCVSDNDQPGTFILQIPANWVNVSGHGEQMTVSPHVEYEGLKLLAEVIIAALDDTEDELLAAQEARYRSAVEMTEYEEGFVDGLLSS